MMIFAPWTKKQVDALNRWQTIENVHPYTCGNRTENHCQGVLKATIDGWICPFCDYKQNWAFDYMMEEQLWLDLAQQARDRWNEEN